MKIYNPFKKHLVQFSNGKYGIRHHTIFGWKYTDLEHGYYSWDKQSMYFENCVTDNEEFAKLHLLTEKVL
jgi:hypothetical protein